jgi:hypothetical protein
MCINKIYSFFRMVIYEFWMAYYYVIYSPKLLFYLILREILYSLVMVNSLIEFVLKKK